jgi:hypothetical protein
MNCLYDERTEKNENQKKKKCCLIMIEGKENKNDAPLCISQRPLDFLFSFVYNIPISIKNKKMEVNDDKEKRGIRSIQCRSI